jgi:hypothetical protein
MEAQMASNAQLARRVHEAWNERNFDEIAEATAPDALLTIVGSGDTFEGPAGTRAYNKMWADGFPDGSVMVDRVIESGDHVVVEFTGRGTHTGTLATSMGEARSRVSAPTSTLDPWWLSSGSPPSSQHRNAGRPTTDRRRPTLGSTSGRRGTAAPA